MLVSDSAVVAQQPVEGVLCSVEWFQPADPLWRCEGAVKKQRAMNKEGKPTVCMGWERRRESCCSGYCMWESGRQKHLLSRNYDILMMFYMTVHLFNLYTTLVL